jgi:hypothetical protein
MAARTSCWVSVLALLVLDGCTSPSPAPAQAGGSGGIGGAGGNGGAQAGAAPEGGHGGEPLGGSGPGWEVPPPDYCTLCQLGATSGQLGNAELMEISGIAASASHPGSYYVHNDSGDSARFFAVDGDGADLGSYTLEAAQADDYEDIALGPCGAGRCVFVADIGDNDEARPYYTILRVAEPASLAAGTTLVHPTQLKFSYPDGPHNAEVLLIHPITGEIAVITSAGSGQTSRFYHDENPLVPAVITELVGEGDIEPPQGSSAFSGGDVHPLGYGVLLRTFTHIWYYAANGPEESLYQTLSRAPCAVPAANEVQAEAVAWRADGAGYVTISEGAFERLHHVECAP